MNDWIKHFLTFGMTSEQAKGAWIAAYRISLMACIVTAFGGFSFVGLSGFARASDTEKKIEAEREAINAKLTAMERSVKLLVENNDRKLKADLASQIRALAYKSCNTPAGQRNQLWAEIEKLQEEYRAVDTHGNEYTIPPCVVL